MGIEDSSSSYDAPTPRAKDDLSSYFHKSTSVVQDYTGRFEDQYARPALTVTQTSFEKKPIATTFIAIFALLSLVPVSSFIGLSLFCIISFAFVALTFVLLASSAAIFVLFIFLGGTLVAIFFTSAFLTAVTLSSYLLLRLATLVRQDGMAGIYGWAGETKDHIIGSTGPTKRVDERSDFAFSDATDDSVVVVQEREPFQSSSDADNEKRRDDYAVKQEQ